MFFEIIVPMFVTSDRIPYKLSFFIGPLCIGFNHYLDKFVCILFFNAFLLQIKSLLILFYRNIDILFFFTFLDATLPIFSNSLFALNQSFFLIEFVNLFNFTHMYQVEKQPFQQDGQI
jgi:hypothetical protein